MKILIYAVVFFMALCLFAVCMAAAFLLISEGIHEIKTREKK